MHPHFTAVIAADHRDQLRRAADAQRVVDQAKPAKSPPRPTPDDGDGRRAMRWLAGNLRWSLTLRRLRECTASPVADASVTRADQHVSTQRRDDSAQRGRVASVQMPAKEAQTRA